MRSIWAAVADAPTAEASASITSVRRNVAERSVRPCGPTSPSRQRSTNRGSSGGGASRSKHPSASTGAKADRGGLVAPALLQRLCVDAVVLRLTGLQGRDLRGTCRLVPGLGEHLLDLGTPLREHLDHFRRYADDLGVTVHDRRELHAEAVGEQMPQVRLVQIPGRMRMFVQADPGDGPPPRIGRIVDRGHVRGDDVGVQQRITRPAGAMIERGRDDPRRRHQVSVLAALAGEDRVGLVVADDLIDRLRMRTPDLAPPAIVSECPQDAHALRRPQRQVITGTCLDPSDATPRIARARSGSPSTRRCRPDHCLPPSRPGGTTSVRRPPRRHRRRRDGRGYRSPSANSPVT